MSSLPPLNAIYQIVQDRNSKLSEDGPFYEVYFPDGRKPWGAVVPIPGEVT